MPKLFLSGFLDKAAPRLAATCWSLAFVAAATTFAQAPDDQAAPVPLLEREPFDRITLDASNDHAVIETQLLDLPDRRVPNPLPESGSLEVRRIDQPSMVYTLAWSAIDKIELYEQLLLDEAKRLTSAGDLREAFQYFLFLKRNYPELPDLERAYQDHLWRDAIDSFTQKKLDNALAVLIALYDRNSQYPRLVNAVQSVSDALVNSQLEGDDVAGARKALDAIEKSFPELRLTNLDQWRDKLQNDAAEQMAAAQRAFRAQQYHAARIAVLRAQSIDPSIAGAAELMGVIQKAAPEFRVGVFAAGEPATGGGVPDWSTARVNALANPRLVELIDFGAEGGVYRCRWGEVQPSIDGMETTVRFSPAALQGGLFPERFALRLLGRGRDASANQDVIGLVREVALADGDGVRIAWRRPNVRPEAYLQIPLRDIAGDQPGRLLWYRPAARDELGARYEPPQRPDADAAEQSSAIVEMLFADDEATVSALLDGEVDAVDRVPPWQIERLRNRPGVKVDRYRLPTIHVLVPNLSNPLMEIREFRRALCYAIDRQSILQDLILGGRQQPGTRTLSGPLPAGESLNDPVGYAYAPNIEPRPYEPRLASVLVGVARAAIEERKRAAKKSNDDDAATAEDQQSESGDGASDDQRQGGAAGDKEAEDQPEPLVIAHQADPIARLACQAIKQQLDRAGIPIRLVELSPNDVDADVQYDLLYAELSVEEPIVDLRRMLGPNGTAGWCSSVMNLRLDELDRATTWRDVLTRAKAIHEIAHYDLPLIPLWQTVNHFAYRDWLQGVGDEPVALYQNVDRWRRDVGGGTR